MSALAALMQRLRLEARSPAFRLSALALLGVELLALYTARDAAEARRAWSYWTLPLLALYLLSRGATGLARRARSGALDLERSRPLAPATRAAVAWLAPALLGAALAAAMLVLGWLLPWTPGFGGESAAWSQRPFPHMPARDLLLDRDLLDAERAWSGLRLPALELAADQSLVLPLTWRPTRELAPGERVRIDLALVPVDGGAAAARMSFFPQRVDELLWTPAVAGEFHLQVEHGGGPGWITLHPAELLLRGAASSPLALGAALWIRVSLFLLWIHLLACTPAWFLRPGIAFGLSACLLLTVFFDPVRLLGWSRLGAATRAWTTLVPDWGAGLALELWARGAPVPLEFFPWLAVALSGAALLILAARGEARGSCGA